MYNNLTYDVYTNYAALVVTAEVGPYAFNPEGTEEDWKAYAAEQLAKHPECIEAHLYREQQDKETGQIDRKFVAYVHRGD